MLALHLTLITHNPLTDPPQLNSTSMFVLVPHSDGVKVTDKRWNVVPIEKGAQAVVDIHTDILLGHSGTRKSHKAAIEKCTGMIEKDFSLVKEECSVCVAVMTQNMSHKFLQRGR